MVKNKNKRESSPPSPQAVPSGADNRKHLWDRFLAIAALVLAVLAMSSDSLLVRVFPKKTFAVSCPTQIFTDRQFDSPFLRLIIGPTPTHPEGSRALLPIQMVAFVEIRNESQHQKQISQLSFEFKAADGRWIAAQCEESLRPLYFAHEPHNRSLMELNTKGTDLIENLAEPIEPKGVKSGWVALTFPEPYRSSRSPQRFRLTISTEFDADEAHEINLEHLPQPMTNGPVSTLRNRAFSPVGTNVDLSSLELVKSNPGFLGLKPQFPAAEPQPKQPASSAP